MEGIDSVCGTDSGGAKWTGRLVAVLLGLLVAGCGGGQVTSGQAGEAGSDGSAGSAGSAGSHGEVQTDLAGVGLEPLALEELQSIMRGFNSQMKLLKLAVREKDAPTAMAAAEEMAEGARRAMASRPRKNLDRIGGYLSFMGSQRAAAMGLKALLEVPAWDATESSLKTLGKNCQQCHTQFRPSAQEEIAFAQEARAQAEAARSATPSTAPVAPEGVSEKGPARVPPPAPQTP